MEITFKAKNNEQIKLVAEQLDFLCIKAFNSQNKKIGYCNFRVKKDTCWIYKIKVEDKDYLGQGVGKKMLKFCEIIAKNNGAHYVEGKFYPDGEGASRAKDFYLKNGYTIDYDGYEQMIFKCLSFDNLLEL